jgi:hypothetical protein
MRKGTYLGIALAAGLFGCGSKDVSLGSDGSQGTPLSEAGTTISVDAGGSQWFIDAALSYPPPSDPPPPFACGGVACTSGQTCCLMTGQCFDPAQAATMCPKPAAGPPTWAMPCSVRTGVGVPKKGILCDDGLPKTTGVCASNADCSATEYCGVGNVSSSELCTSVGYCTPRLGSTQPTILCGCDGVTYTTAADALTAGVRVAYGGPCGDAGAP